MLPASAPPAVPGDWSGSSLGHPSSWPLALRLAVDIVLDNPHPMLLLWGQPGIPVFNEAYAVLAGPFHPPAPGGRAMPLRSAPLAANPDAYQLALNGEHQRLAGQRLTFLTADGPAGADFDLRLTPLRGEHGQVQGVMYAMAPGAPASRAGPSELRVLVVEDNLDSQYLVCEMLKAMGHAADGVGHAEGALEMLSGARYQVLFSDVSLPGMSGVDLARQALRLQPGLRVVFASGYGDALLRHVEFPYQSLQKPFEMEHLHSMLDNIAVQLGGLAR